MAELSSLVLSPSPILPRAVAVWQCRCAVGWRQNKGASSVTGRGGRQRDGGCKQGATLGRLTGQLQAA